MECVGLLTRHRKSADKPGQLHHRPSRTQRRATRYALGELRDEWRAAEFVKDDDEAGRVCRQIFDAASEDRRTPFHLYLRGTNFQLKVWQALLTIPSGKLANY